MYIHKMFILFLHPLYLGIALCFHKNIQVNTHIPYLHKKTSLCESISYEVSQSKSFLSNISLPYLSPNDKITLREGKRIQRQEKIEEQKQEQNGRRGSGFVVVDIHSPPDMVFNILTRFDMYKDMIPIIKSSRMISHHNNAILTEFVLNKFRLHINIEHTILENQRMILFDLDPNRQNPVFKEAKGFWHVEVPEDCLEDHPEGYCRVYLSVQIQTHKMVPPLILDYISSNALSKATDWLKPFCDKNIESPFSKK